MRSHWLSLSALSLVGLSSFVARDAFAETYKVGPGEQFADLSGVESILKPGDVVEVAGDHTYPGNIHIRPESSGTPDAKVTIRGVPVNGKRPTISGGDEWSIVLHASHFVFENFEITGGQAYCLVHKADDVTVRNVVVHDCPNHGILGTDEESGSALFEYVEVYHTGTGDHHHQIYMATDETMYPGSVFRLQHSYIHDGNGGNSVKSRSERNEIYSNWIEGDDPGYHLLDLIGPDGQDPSLAREDSDVVGNVLVQHGQWNISRFGGDGTGETGGRYRFAFNTIVLGPNAQAFRAQDSVESVEISNNVFYSPDGNAPDLLRDPEGNWTTGSRTLAGANNLFSTTFPTADELTNSIVVADPGFADFVGFDLVPVKGSPLVDAADANAKGPAGLEIPKPQVIPIYVPPRRGIDAGLAAAPRNMVGPPDIGAYEFGSPTNPATSTSAGAGSTGASTGAGGSPIGDTDDTGGGCSCSFDDPRTAGTGLVLALGGLVAALHRRARRASPAGRDR
ncbi:MAG: hypothetical protein U0414_22070 [Polyangiaceae bacterium]